MKQLLEKDLKIQIYLIFPLNICDYNQALKENCYKHVFYHYLLNEFLRFNKSIFIEKYSLKFPKGGIFCVVEFINQWLDGTKGEWPTFQ